jgi:hypothetical protein
LVLILFLLELFGEMNTLKISTKHGTKKFSLEACGIETEQTLHPNKEMLWKITDPIAKEWFCEAFDVELEVGKWYKVLLIILIIL